jgi:hypothetical protein
MALSSAELEFESGAVLPARDTMLTVNLSLVTSRISANSAFVSLVNKAAGNQVTGAAGATIGVSQTVTQVGLNL